MTLATCAKDVKFYKFPSITLIGVYETPEDCMCVKSLSWCSEGKQVVIVKSKGPPALLTAPMKPEDTIEPCQYFPKSAATVATFCNTRNKLIAFGTADGEVIIHDIRKKRNVGEYYRLPTAVQNLEFSPDDFLLAAGCINGQLFLYNNDKKPCASFMVPNSSSLSTMVYHKFIPNILAAASKEGVVCIWDAETTHSKLVGRDHSNIVTDLGFHGDLMSTVGVDGKLVSYDMRTFKYTVCFNLKTPLAGLAYIPNNFEMAISTCDGQLRSYDTRFMTSPLNTVVAYNNWIKKISFAQVLKDDQMKSERYKSSNYKSIYAKAHSLYEDPKTASGDFTIFSDSNSVLSHHYEGEPNRASTLHDLPPSASVANLIRQKVSASELKEFSKVLEERIKICKAQFEEKLLQTFYGMRIDASKQFIGVEERVAQSWNNFVEYLKQSGAQSVKSTGRNVYDRGCENSNSICTREFIQMPDISEDER